MLLSAIDSAVFEKTNSFFYMQYLRHELLLVYHKLLMNSYINGPYGIIL